MTTIIEALKKQRGTRVSYGDRWMVWHDRQGWVVYTREHGQRKTYTLITLIETKDEAKAIKYLLYEEAS